MAIQLRPPSEYSHHVIYLLSCQNNENKLTRYLGFKIIIVKKKACRKAVGVRGLGL